MRPKTIIYVDGFNLFYGALKGTPYKWLDLVKLSENVLPKNQVVQVKYFTALITTRGNDEGPLVRQQTYLRALRSLQKCSLYLGHFLTHKVQAKLVNPIAGQRFVEIFKTEEKGSDVNLASHMLLDGFRNRFDVAVILSNDSDLLTPMQMVQNELGKPVGVLFPSKRPSKQLKKHATFHKHISRYLKRSQLPVEIIDSNGKIFKPGGW